MPLKATKANDFLKVSTVGSAIAIVIDSDVTTLEAIQRVPRELVARLKRTADAARLVSSDVQRRATAVGGSTAVYASKRLEVAQRLSLGSPGEVRA